MAKEYLTENFHGQTAICGLFASWLADLKATPSSADTGKKEDNTTTAANEVRDIAQNVINDIAKDKFNKTEGDEIFNLQSQAHFILEMIESPRWRKLLIDLAGTNRDSVLLKYCLRIISERGNHRELVKRINMTEDFLVFNSTLKAQFSAIGDMLSSISADAESSLDLSGLVEDTKRMCTSASFTYLYAVEVSHEDRAKASEPLSSLIQLTSPVAPSNSC